MTLLSIIIFLLIGGISGWLAGLLITGRGFGMVGDIIVGIIGAFIGGFVLIFFGLAGLFGAGIVSAVIVAFIGAVILLSVIKIIKKI
ncbi:MAG: GlsB/YeaQ/YmgE family stress response membrane protein [Acidithiobacillus ferrooxidans]